MAQKQPQHGVMRRSESRERFTELVREMRGSPGPLKKGSAEARQHMAELRARRKS